MKPLKLNSFHKFICFVLIVILTVAAVGFAADGWQTDTNQPDSGDVGQTDDEADENKDGNNEQNNNPDQDNNDNIEEDKNNNQNDESADSSQDQDNETNQPDPPQDNGENTEQPDKDENSDETNKDDEKDDIVNPPVDNIPEEIVYINPITGLQISEEESKNIPLGIVVNPSAPLYGISNADIAIEFPTETGETRLLSYSSAEDVIWKIGALAATRKYISNMSNFFGGIVVYYGNDDKVVYNAWETSQFELDLSAYQDSYYAENTLYIYTSQTLIENAIRRNPDLTYAAQGYQTPPYSFSDSSEVIGNTIANTVIIPFSSENETEFYYHEKTDKYLMYKSGNRKMDMLNGKNIAFNNLFILFSDAVTYEKAEGTELVMDTTSGGKGYYISKGALTEFRWSTDKSGALCFKSLSGDDLTVNRGNVYIAFYKAACSSSVKAY